MKNAHEQLSDGGAGALAVEPSEPRLRVSVIVPTYNRNKLLEKTLRSLLAQEYPDDCYEIVVVDSGDDDGTAGMVAGLQQEAGRRIRYLTVPSGGPACSRNRGIAEVFSEAVALVDSDATLDPRWLQYTTAAMAASEEVGIVSGKVVYASRPSQLNSYGGVLGPIGLAWDRHEGEDHGQIDGRARCLWSSTAAALVRRALLDRQGGFDETLFYGYEDTDLGWQANLYGYQVVCIPEAVAYHSVDETVARSDPRIVFHYCKNRLRVMLKNCGPGRLVKYVPLYLIYALTDLVIRSPRVAKFKALMWNVRMLPDTLRQRRRIQGNRVVSDRQIAHLFSKRYFPPVALGGLRRRPVDSRSGHAPSSPVGSDDRLQ